MPVEGENRIHADFAGTLAAGLGWSRPLPESPSAAGGYGEPITAIDIAGSAEQNFAGVVRFTPTMIVPWPIGPTTRNGTIAAGRSGRSVCITRRWNPASKAGWLAGINSITLSEVDEGC